MIKQTCRKFLSRLSQNKKQADAQFRFLLLSLVERNCDTRLLQMKARRWERFVGRMRKEK